jgi:hypothetical protein
LVEREERESAERESEERERAERESERTEGGAWWWGGRERGQ